MKFSTFVIAVMIAVLSTSVIANVLYMTYFRVDRELLEARVIVGEEVGFSTDTTQLDFGSILPGSTGKRFLNLSHPYEYPMKVGFSAEGQIADFLRLSDNYFILGPGEHMAVTLYVRIPFETAPGTYTGQVYLEFRRSLG